MDGLTSKSSLRVAQMHDPPMFGDAGKARIRRKAPPGQPPTGKLSTHFRNVRFLPQ